MSDKKVYSSEIPSPARAAEAIAAGKELQLPLTLDYLLRQYGVPSIPLEQRTPCDLHGLTARYGTRLVADLIGISYRNLLDLRHGTRPLTVDHLSALVKHFPEFDAKATVVRIGTDRDEKGISYSQRRLADADATDDN